jgi:hypothetical protein
MDSSRLLRGKELKEAEKQIASAGPATEPYLTELQRLFMTRSWQSVRRRQAMPFIAILLLAVAIFLGGKFYFLIIPIANACPEVRRVAIAFEGSELPENANQALSNAMENRSSETTLRNCDAGVEAEILVTAIFVPGTSNIELHVRLPETPAYKLDFLQEIRGFGPEVVSEAEAIALLHAFSAYSVGEYQTAMDLLEGYDSLSALTLLAQARLFTNDLVGSQEAYGLALQKPSVDDVYTGKLYMGTALALWRPESYDMLSLRGNKNECKKAGEYYAQAVDRLEGDKLADNIRIIYAWTCITKQDEKDSAYATYVPWKSETPQSESNMDAKDAAYINATQQYILAVTDAYEDDEATRTIYKERLIAAQPLLLARAMLSEFYWGVEDNCRDARKWLDEFRSEMISDIEKTKLRRLLQSQPLFCR